MCFMGWMHGMGRLFILLKSTSVSFLDHVIPALALGEFSLQLDEAPA
jgi:hypothetical protein